MSRNERLIEFFWQSRVDSSSLSSSCSLSVARAFRARKGEEGNSSPSPRLWERRETSSSLPLSTIASPLRTIKAVTGSNVFDCCPRRKGWQARESGVVYSSSSRRVHVTVQSVSGSVKFANQLVRRRKYHLLFLQLKLLSRTQSRAFSRTLNPLVHLGACSSSCLSSSNQTVLHSCPPCFLNKCLAALDSSISSFWSCFN